MFGPRAGWCACVRLLLVFLRCSITRCASACAVRALLRARVKVTLVRLSVSVRVMSALRTGLSVSALMLLGCPMGARAPPALVEVRLRRAPGPSKGQACAEVVVRGKMLALLYPLSLLWCPAAGLLVQSNATLLVVSVGMRARAAHAKAGVCVVGRAVVFGAVSLRRGGPAGALALPASRW